MVLGAVPGSAIVICIRYEEEEDNATAAADDDDGAVDTCFD